MRLARTLAVLALISGCGGSNNSPTSPSSTSPTPTTLAIGGCLTADRFQCRSVATLSNNTTQDVTSQTQWSTSDSAIATIAPTGLMSLVASGSVQVRAGYQGLSATLDLAVTVGPTTPPPQFFTLVGVVADTGGRAIAGAQVSARDSDGSTRTATTDGNGFFSVAPLRQGSVAVTVTASGYQSATRTVTLSGDTRMTDILLAAVVSAPPPSGSCTGVPSSVACGRPTAQCNNNQWSCSQNRQGTCSSNGGVRCWVCPGPLC